MKFRFLAEAVSVPIPDLKVFAGLPDALCRIILTLFTVYESKSMALKSWARFSRQSDYDNDIA